jgi:hypothetical protein
MPLPLPPYGFQEATDYIISELETKPEGLYFDRTQPEARYDAISGLVVNVAPQLILPCCARIWPNCSGIVWLAQPFNRTV